VASEELKEDFRFFSDHEVLGLRLTASLNLEVLSFNIGGIGNRHTIADQGPRDPE
jgi:hypothetical protein